jgi:hypothetical protein
VPTKFFSNLQADSATHSRVQASIVMTIS